MLTRKLKRVLLDSRWPLPPPFLLPWSASLTTVSHTSTSTAAPPPFAASKQSGSQSNLEPQRTRFAEAHSTVPVDNQAPASLPSPESPTSSTSTPLDLSPSIRELLPLLKAQSPHYITIHIHGKPYLVTQGDTVRLPFLMHGVEPGDILRLNRAINIGSRDYTLKAAASAPRLKSPTTDTRNVIDPTTGSWASESQAMPSTSSTSDAMPRGVNVQFAPHFIPHIEKGKHRYIDDRLFVCRAVVMGVDSEPLRIKEKTKQRQRKVKRVKSKHRFTILKVKEVKVRAVEEIERGDVD